MTKVISFISRKGGCGKTTNAIQLATSLHSLGSTVVLIETDTNYTLGALREMELFRQGKKKSKTFPILASTDQQVLKELEDYKGSFDYVIVDSAGKTTSKAIKELCMLSNLVLIPSSLSPNDLLVTYQTVEDIQPAMELNKNLLIAVLPSRINSRTGKDTIEKAFTGLKVPVLKQFLASKNAFVQSSTLIPEKEYLPLAKAIVKLIPQL